MLVLTLLRSLLQTLPPPLLPLHTPLSLPLLHHHVPAVVNAELGICRPTLVTTRWVGWWRHCRSFTTTPPLRSSFSPSRRRMAPIGGLGWRHALSPCWVRIDYVMVSASLGLTVRVAMGQAIALVAMGFHAPPTHPFFPNCTDIAYLFPGAGGTLCGSERNESPGGGRRHRQRRCELGASACLNVAAIKGSKTKTRMRRMIG